MGHKINKNKTHERCECRTRTARNRQSQMNRIECPITKRQGRFKGRKKGRAIEMLSEKDVTLSRHAGPVHKLTYKGLYAQGVVRVTRTGMCTLTKEIKKRGHTGHNKRICPNDKNELIHYHKTIGHSRLHACDAVKASGHESCKEQRPIH